MRDVDRQTSRQDLSSRGGRAQAHCRPAHNVELQDRIPLRQRARHHRCYRMIQRLSWLVYANPAGGLGWRLRLTERTLVLVRHGQSFDNERDLFSGWRNPDLTAQGVLEARSAGRRLRELAFCFELAFTSELTRAQHTLALIQKELGQPALTVCQSRALNERNYGELAGLNKEEARERWSTQQVHLWRKSFDAIPPGDESLAMTAERVVPYYLQEIEPRIQEGKRTLVVAHGNSLRALVMHLDQLTAGAVEDLHLATAQMLVYRFDKHGSVVEKQSILAQVGGS